MIRVLDRVRQGANVLFVPAGIALTYADHGRNVGLVARVNEPLLAAAGWAFAIWGLLFAGQIAYAIYQLLPSQAHRPLHRRVGWFAALNGILGGVWTVAFAHGWSSVAWATMLLLLANLILLSAELREEARKGRDYFLVRLPFALNFGWISVAAILNTAHYFNQVAGYDGAPLAWAHALVCVAAFLGLFMILVRDEAAFALPVAWGLFGIAAYRYAAFPSLAFFAAGAAITLLSFAAAHALLRRARAGELRAHHPPTGRALHV